MADFPPNLEDGEFWIPSDVFHEIISSPIRPQKDSQPAPNNKSANIVNPHVVHQSKKLSTKSILPKTTPNSNSQAKFWRPHWYADQTQMQPHNYRFPSIHHGNASLQLFPRPVHLNNPIFQPTIQNKVALNFRGMMDNFAPNHGGTGVYLPPSVAVLKYDQVDQESTTENVGTDNIPDHRPDIVTAHKKKKSKFLESCKTLKSNPNFVV
ncbi:hypothetical protein TIFTF001_030093 [Ficus carica]|uniref:Uncharacterized protein n=1 Tax=Ficus carica TaxID=3494 RepID=A0AA88DSS2_FICCA|nr:hypothetical protein TIFTF001_030093 [Ficus carica]